MKGQLLLLHTQLLYERQKRQLHAERNRRLLSRVCDAVKIKENNLSLVTVSCLSVNQVSLTVDSAHCVTKDGLYLEYIERIFEQIAKTATTISFSV